MSKHRRAARRENPPRPGEEAGTARVRAATSVAEIAAYGLFGSVVAGAVLVLGGQPRWYAVAVVAGAVVLVAVLVLASSRAPRASATSTAPRRGRRRRR